MPGQARVVKSSLKSRPSRERLYRCAMNAIESIKRDLTPKFEDLLMHLNSSDQMAASISPTFVDLNAVASEEQLLELFIELLTTAFLGISFDEVALDQIDNILMTAEQISETLAVTGEHPQ